MAPKRLNTGKGKVGEEGPSEVENTHQGMERDIQEAWEASIKNRGVKNERHIIDDGSWPENYGPFQAINEQGLRYWFEPNPGFNTILVEKFYKFMTVPEAGKFLAPGAKIKSKIDQSLVFITVDDIAAAWGYQRPVGPTNCPKPEGDYDQREVAESLYDVPANARIPHWPGRLNAQYRVVNQLVCYNLQPRGNEGAPQLAVGNLMLSFMADNTVCDWAQYVFGQMCDFRDASLSTRMPFPCLVTRIMRMKGIAGNRYYKNDELIPGGINSSIIARSRAQVRTAEGSLLTPPPPNASVKVWMEKIFGCVTAMARGQRKQKKQLKLLERNQQDLADRQKHLQSQLAGQNPGTFQPRQWPELEVSDDFGDGAEGDEQSDAEH